MDYTKEQQNKKFVVGLTVRTSNAPGRFLKDVSPLWERFHVERYADKILNRKGSGFLAVYFDYESDYTKPFSYILGCEVTKLEDIPEGLVGIEIPAASYAVFTASGEYPQSMAHVWEKIWKSGAKRAYTVDFEVYERDFDPKNRPEIKIYIALQT